jgi:uncharacterized membrane protein YjgN (DUF898 family)
MQELKCAVVTDVLWKLLDVFYICIMSREVWKDAKSYYFSSTQMDRKRQESSISTVKCHKGEEIYHQFFNFIHIITTIHVIILQT